MKIYNNFMQKFLMKMSANGLRIRLSLLQVSTEKQHPLHDFYKKFLINGKQLHIKPNLSMLLTAITEHILQQIA